MEEMREKIIEIFNDTQLPLEAKFYVFKDVFRDITEVYSNYLKTKNKQEESEVAE